MAVKRDHRQRIWRAALKMLVDDSTDPVNNPPQFTTSDLADDLDISQASAGGLAKRLASWGYVKRVGFCAADQKRGRKAGRQQVIYEVTKKGIKAAEYEPEE